MYQEEHYESFFKNVKSRIRQFNNNNNTNDNDNDDDNNSRNNNFTQNMKIVG